MQVLDASSIIYGWDNYPINQFPPFWEWIESQIENGNLSIPQVAFREVQQKTPDCSDWLQEKSIHIHPMSNAILSQSLAIKNLLGISSDDYHVRGVGENDILIISTAKINGLELITNEEKQLTLPQNLKKYKIPAVCNMSSISVANKDFVEYIKQSNQVFA